MSEGMSNVRISNIANIKISEPSSAQRQYRKMKEQEREKKEKIDYPLFI